MDTYLLSRSTFGKWKIKGEREQEREIQAKCNALQ